MFSDLCQNLQKITQNHKRIMNTMLEPYGLTYPQYLVLHTVFEKGQILAQELIVLLDSDKATLSGIIRRLHERDWLIKEEDPKDKRKQILSLSFEGRNKMHAIGSLEDQCENMLMHSYPLKDQKKFQQYLEEMIENQSQYLNQSR
jgi:DNA-binding MarR family transcriptional regulator